MATIFERRNSDGELIGFQAKIRRKGYPPQSKTFDRKTDAMRWATDVESAMSRRVFVDRSETDRNTLWDLLERYKKEISPTKRGAAQEVSAIDVIQSYEIADLAMSALGSSDMAKFRDEMVGAKYAPATIVRRLNLVATVIGHARREWGINVVENVASATLTTRPKYANRKRDRRLREGEEAKLFTQLSIELHSKYLETLARLAIETAARQGELCSLRWPDIDIARRVVTVRGLSGDGSKNGEIREVPLSLAAIDAINSLPRQLKDNRLFPIEQNTLKVAFGRAVTRAKLDDLTFHDLRHEATSRLAGIYTNPLELMRITGHKTLSELARYYHADAAALAKRMPN